MTSQVICRIITLSGLFIKEQTKDPATLIWVMISPCALFYLFSHTNRNPDYFTGNYIAASAWFYAYIASSNALFGFSLYIIGRRESGFIRSFIYSRNSKTIFLSAHFLAYSIVSMSYCLTFYITTKCAFAFYDTIEFLLIALRFYVCFLMFCSLGVTLTLLPINFQSSSTVMSIFSFFMLVLGAISASNTDSFTNILNKVNPLSFANEIMANGLTANPKISLSIIAIATTSAFILLKHLKINPVWSRY